ncbi:MAG TPA: ATP-binding protein [Kineosporiaceae bacterium]
MSSACQLVVDLSAQPQAAAVARRTIQDALRRWRVHPARIEDAQLIASELVANAQRYGRQPMSLRLALVPPALTVCVCDDGKALPQLTARDLYDERGRGLPIVAAVAHSWGVQRVSDGGKQVWARLRLDPDGTHGHTVEVVADGGGSRERPRRGRPGGERAPGGLSFRRAVLFRHPLRLPWQRT